MIAADPRRVAPGLDPVGFTGAARLQAWPAGPMARIRRALLALLAAGRDPGPGPRRRLPPRIGTGPGGGPGPSHRAPQGGLPTAGIRPRSRRRSRKWTCCAGPTAPWTCSPWSRPWPSCAREQGEQGRPEQRPADPADPGGLGPRGSSPCSGTRIRLQRQQGPRGWFTSLTDVIDLTRHRLVRSGPALAVGPPAPGLAAVPGHRAALGLGGWPSACATGGCVPPPLGGAAPAQARGSPRWRPCWGRS